MAFTLQAAQYGRNNEAENRFILELSRGTEKQRGFDAGHCWPRLGQHSAGLETQLVSR